MSYCMCQARTVQPLRGAAALPFSQLHLTARDACAAIRQYVQVMMHVSGMPSASRCGAPQLSSAAWLVASASGSLNARTAAYATSR